MISRTSMADTLGTWRPGRAGTGARAVGLRRGAQDADERVRRALERAGTEHEHEAAAARVLPLDVAHAGHPRLDDAADDVEAHLVADVDAEALVDAVLDRHLELGASAASGACPPRTARSVTSSFGSRSVAVGDRVLAAERAAAAHVGVVFEIDVAAVHAGHAGAQHRNQRPAWRPRCRPRGTRECRRLILLDVDQEHVRALPAARRSRSRDRFDCSARTPRRRSCPARPRAG